MPSKTVKREFLPYISGESPILAFILDYLLLILPFHGIGVD